MRKALLIALLLVSATAHATVTSATRAVTYTPDGDTVFAVPFHFISKTHLLVTKTLISTGVGTEQTRGTHYTVTLPIGSVQGSVTMGAAVTTDYTLTIERNMPMTQLTAFKSQGTYSGKNHEDALDKLTMIAIELTNTVTASGDISAAIDAHAAAADPHVGYAILAGRSGGQALHGGTSTGQNLTLESNTSNDGDIVFGGSVYDEDNDRLGLGTSSPAAMLEVSGGSIFLDTTDDITISHVAGEGIYQQGGTYPFLLSAYETGGTTAAAALRLYSSTHATKASDASIASDKIWFHPVSLVDADAFATLTASGLTLDANSYLRMSGTAELSAPFIGGSISSAEDLTLVSNHHSSDGFIYFGIAQASAYDETNERFGINSATPQIELEVDGEISGRRYPIDSLLKSHTVQEDSDCNSVIFLGTQNAISELPTLDGTTDKKGCEVTLVFAGDGLTFKVQPQITDDIVGTCIGGAGTVVFDTDDGEGIQTVAATQEPGDTMTLVAGIGTSDKHWFLVTCSGDYETF